LGGVLGLILCGGWGLEPLPPCTPWKPPNIFSHERREGRRKERRRRKEEEEEENEPPIP
jgi:hypothetical protein